MPSGEQMPRPGDPDEHQITSRWNGVWRAGLQDVAMHGGPAQAEQARQLLERYASGGGSELDADAARLIDAYLNDPYLTR